MYLQIDGVNKKYGKNVVLKNISIEAEKGKCIGLLGVNGSGKSTLLNILAGIISANSGTFSLDGVNLFKNKKIRSDSVAYVPQGISLIRELTAYDNLRMWYTKDEIAYSLNNSVLGKLGISEFLKKPVSKMSGGMQKRLSIGCAVASNPSVLLLDEPSAALDLVCKNIIYEYIDEFRSKGGIVIIATHDLGELPLCDELYILKEGQLLPYAYDGNVSELVDLLK